MMNLFRACEEQCSTWNTTSVPRSEKSKHNVPRGTSCRDVFHLEQSLSPLNSRWVTGQNMLFCLAVQSIAAVNNLGFCVHGWAMCSTWNTFLRSSPNGG